MASVCTNSHLTWLELDSFEPSDNSWRDINFFCNRSVKMDKALDSVSHTKGRIKPDGLTLCGIQEGMKSFSNPISSWCQCCLHPRVKWSRGEDVTIATKTGGICTGLRLQHFSLLSPLTGFQIGGGGEGLLFRHVSVHACHLVDFYLYLQPSSNVRCTAQSQRSKQNTHRSAIMHEASVLSIQIYLFKYDVLF